MRSWNAMPAMRQSGDLACLGRVCGAEFVPEPGTPVAHEPLVVPTGGGLFRGGAFRRSPVCDPRRGATVFRGATFPMGG